MSATLATELDLLDYLTKTAREVKVNCDEQEVRDARTRALSGFYSRNEIARDVSKGRESYVRLIEPIKKRFGTYWRRFRHPRIDPSFDEEARRILGSMKDVGVESARWLDPETFTTAGRRKDMFGYEVGSSFIGGVPSGLCAFAYSCRGENSVEGLAAALVVAAPLIIMYGSTRLLDPNKMKRSVLELKVIAQKSDDFLRQNSL